MTEDTPDEGERSFRELTDNAPVMIWRSGRDGLCDWFNQPWLDFVGRGMDQELGDGWSQGVHPDDRERCLATYSGAFGARRRFTMTYRLRHADGDFRLVLDNGAPFYRGGEFAGFIGSCTDITEQQALELQLRHAQKMEAIGQLTGGVAHDFNNLLQVISANLQLLSNDLPDDGRVRRRLRNAMEAVARGTNLASQLLAFARSQPLRPKVVNTGRLIQESEDMLRRALGDAVDLTISIGGGLWNTLVDPVQLETALLNLAANARDAMDGRGRLILEVSNAELEPEAPSRRPDPTAGQHVMVAVTDTGCGMSQETVERVFDPFFTTKPEGRGTGLGLSMVHGFVKQSGGRIRIDSKPGCGTTVRIYLPRSRELEDQAAKLDPGFVTGGVETILLVEDDDQVRNTTADLLGELGYKVLEARDADSAMTIIESGAAVDLLFTDVVMPGVLPSAELVRRSQQRLPGLGVLFTSGYADVAADRRVALAEGAELLSKPYTREDLDLRLRRILAGRGSTDGGAPLPGL
jgi:PAS domain S-box-containing protein